MAHVGPEPTTPSPGYGPGYPPPQPPKKKRHIFRWVFLAVQALFLIWIITGVNSVSSGKCDPQMTHAACTAAKQVGGGIGVALIIGLWVAVDIILGITYLIVRKK